MDSVTPTQAASPTMVVVPEESEQAGVSPLAAALERVGDRWSFLLVETLLTRYAVERAIQRATDDAFEVAGALALARSPDIGMLLAASRALSYHPPSRQRAEVRLADYYRGAGLELE